MFKLFVIALAILGVSMLFLCANLLLKKNGRFPNSHVSANKEMRKRGIGCVQSQDKAMRTPNPHAIRERV